MTRRHGPIEAYLAAIAVKRIDKVGRQVVTDAVGHLHPSWVSKWKSGVLHASIDELVAIYDLLGMDLRRSLVDAVREVERRSRK